MTKSLLTEGSVERCMSLRWQGSGIEYSVGKKRTSKTVKPMKTKSAASEHLEREIFLFP